MEAPLLETARLRLRAVRATDLTPLLAMWQEPAFYQHLGGQPQGEFEVWSRLLRNAGLWPVCHFGYWAVEEKATGQFIGSVGFADFHRALTPALGPCPEAGWVLAPHAHGRGYATEALQAILAWGDACFTQPRTVCIISPDNHASLRVAAKLGYVEYACTELSGQPIRLLERFAPGAS